MQWCCAAYAFQTVEIQSATVLIYAGGLLSSAKFTFTLLRNVICVQLRSLQLCFVKAAGGVRGLAMRKVESSKDNSTRFVTKLYGSAAPLKISLGRDQGPPARERDAAESHNF